MVVSQWLFWELATESSRTGPIVRATNMCEEPRRNLMQNQEAFFG